MKRMNLLGLIAVVFAVSILSGCATMTASNTGENFSWWGKSGAQPAPVGDTEMGVVAGADKAGVSYVDHLTEASTPVPADSGDIAGSWWMPNESARGPNDNTQWGNRGYLYVAQPAPKAPKPAPMPEVVAPKPAAEKIVEKRVVVEKIVEKPVDRIVEKTVEKTVYVDKVVEKTVYVNVQDVYFLYDSSALTAFAKGILDNNVEVFKKYPKIKAILVGYASPEGTDEYNRKLSERRALAVKNYLVQAGISENILTVKPMGELQAAQSSWPFARKVHFEIVSE